MKWVFRFTTILVLVAAMSLPFFIDNKDGEPMLSLPNTDSFLPSKSSTAAITNVLPTTTTVFKWKDKDGVWHYTDQAPKDQVDIETVEVDTRTNIIQSFSDSSPDATADSASTTAAQMTSPDDDFLSMDRAMNVMQDAKLARKAMEQRNQQLQKIVGEQAP